jgi:hypothetical protein
MPETSSQFQSWPWVILIASRQNNKHHHIKLKDWPLNQPLIAPNSHENPSWHSQEGMFTQGKKPSGHFTLFFSFSQNKQKTDHQSELNSEASRNPNLWKASLCCANSPYQSVSNLLPWISRMNKWASCITCDFPTHPPGT